MLLEDGHVRVFVFIGLATVVSIAALEGMFD
jgi:hypothetical protein